MISFKKKFRSIKKLPTWIFWFPATLLKLLVLCCFRVRIVDPHNLIETARGAITVTWHNRLLFFPALFPRAARERTVAVVSASRDGQYIADLVSFFQIRCLRGSSSRRGATAQLEAIRAIRQGLHVAFTPDGPRGPRYVMSKGPIHLASLTGAPVVPVTINASRYWSIRSWDAFQIPKPFATLTLVLGDPISVPPDLDSEGIEQYRKIIETRLREIGGDQL